MTLCTEDSSLRWPPRDPEREPDRDPPERVALEDFTVNSELIPAF